jgi:hypothetical protein
MVAKQTFSLSFGQCRITCLADRTDGWVVYTGTITPQAFLVKIFIARQYVATNLAFVGLNLDHVPV